MVMKKERVILSLKAKSSLKSGKIFKNYKIHIK
jgi:hypothetical protein